MKYCTWVGITDHQRAPIARATRLPASGSQSQTRRRGRGASRCGRAPRPGRGRCSITSPSTTASKRRPSAAAPCSRSSVRHVEAQAVARVGRGELARLDADLLVPAALARLGEQEPHPAAEVEQRAAPRAWRSMRSSTAAPSRAGRPPRRRSRRSPRRRRRLAARRRRACARAACGRSPRSARCRSAPCRTGRSWGSVPRRPCRPRRAGAARSVLRAPQRSALGVPPRAIRRATYDPARPSDGRKPRAGAAERRRADAQRGGHGARVLRARRRARSRALPCELVLVDDGSTDGTPRDPRRPRRARPRASR